MLPNAFIGKSSAPTKQELRSELGSAMALWDRLLQELATELDVAACEWNSYSRKAGWSLKVKRGQRTIVYLSPCHGSFRASFALGDKAVEAALASKLPNPVLTNIREAKRYAEGTAVRIDVTGEKDITVIVKLAKSKVEN